VALEFLLAASQGSLIGLNFMEPPANFGQFLSGHAAVLAAPAPEPDTVEI
jgi:hypothetical protein